MRREKHTDTTGVILLLVSYLLEVLYMVFGGYKNHSLLLRLRYVPQQMKQQCRLVIHAQMEK